MNNEQTALEINGFTFNWVGDLIGKPETVTRELLETTLTALHKQGEHIKASRIQHSLIAMLTDINYQGDLDAIDIYTGFKFRAFHNNTDYEVVSDITDSVKDGVKCEVVELENMNTNKRFNFDVELLVKCLKSTKYAIIAITSANQESFVQLDNDNEYEVLTDIPRKGTFYHFKEAEEASKLTGIRAVLIEQLHGFYDLDRVRKVIDGVTTWVEPSEEEEEQAEKIEVGEPEAAEPVLMGVTITTGYALDVTSLTEAQRVKLQQDIRDNTLNISEVSKLLGYDVEQKSVVHYEALTDDV